MKLIVTFKPSMAETIAKSVGANEKIGTRDDGFYYKNDDFVVICYVGYTLRYIPENVMNKSDIEIIPYSELIETPKYKNQYDLLQKFMLDKRFDEIVLLVDTEEERDDGIFHFLYNKNDCTTPYKSRLLFCCTTDEVMKLITD